MYEKRNGRHLHRTVAEHKIGRPLAPGEVVHHIDGDPLNNAPENLEVLPSQAEHARLHHLGTKRDPRTTCKRGHAMTSENTYLHPSGRRVCIACRRAYDNKWKKSKRSERGPRKRGPSPEAVRRRSRDDRGRFAKENDR